MNLLSDTCNYKDIKYFTRYIIFRIIPPIFYNKIIEYKYKKELEQVPNLIVPTKLSEKIQWLKFNNNNRLKTTLSDKLLAKDFIKKNLPELKTTKLYQHCKKFDELNFETLPDSFVLKTNHAWRTNLVILEKNKLTKREMKKLKKYYDWTLKINYGYWSFYELQYKDIKPKIFAEEYICNNEREKHIEYEVYCFNGVPEFVKLGLIIKEPFNDYEHRENHYLNINYKKTPFVIRQKNKNSLPPKSKNFDKMIEYAKFLAKDFDFVRVDFMEAKEILYFGEMTFTPFCGFLEFKPEEFDLYFGKKLRI